MPIVRFKGNTLDPGTLDALVAGTLVNGSKPSAWWKRQSADFRNSFMDTVRTSMRNGESLTQGITRVVGGTIDGVTVPGIMKTTKAKAGALVSTSMSAVTNEAALKSFQANNDVIKAVTQLSTLDNRTSDICIAYSGQTWDINTLQPVPEMGGTLPYNGGPPRHFNCRSRLTPVTKSFRELGLDRDEIPPGTRASMDGQVPEDITFDKFLRGKSQTFQDQLLGPARARLWRNGDINLTQLVDMRGNPMTLTQLEAKVGIRPQPRPRIRPQPSTPPKPDVKMVNSFLETDVEGVFVQIPKADMDEITGHAKRLVKRASEADEVITQEIIDLADDVGAKFPNAIIDDVDTPNGSLEFRLKDGDSTGRKIQTYARDRNLSYSEAADQISDSLRYTYVLDEDDYVDGVKAVMERFAEMGYKNGKFDPAWLTRPDYRGLNINMISPQGVRIELQVHTSRSFFVKQELNHALYEEFRTLSKAMQKGPKGQAIQAEMLKNAQSIKMPGNIEFLDELKAIYNNPTVAKQNQILIQASQRVAQRESLALRSPLPEKQLRIVNDPIKSEQHARAFLKSNLFDDKFIDENFSADLLLLQEWNPRLAREWKKAAEKLRKELLEQEARIAAAQNPHAEAIEEAMKGTYKKFGETKAVVKIHAESFDEAPSYIRSAIAQRKPLTEFVWKGDSFKKKDGAWYDDIANKIYMNEKTHPNKIGWQSTWRHEYGHAVDYGLAARYYELAGVPASVDKWGAPIISARFNKSLLADSRKFQKWKYSSERIGAYNKRVLEIKEKALDYTVPGSGKRIADLYDPMLKKHGMNYEMVLNMARRNYNLPAGQLENFVDEWLIPNMITSIETGRVQGFFEVATRGIFQGGADMASLSDYVGSITRNKVRGTWGHSNAYYGSGKHGPTGKHKEAFANFFGMMGGKDREFFEALLRSWGTDKYLDDLLGAMRLLENGGG